MITINPITAKKEYAKRADAIALGLLFHACLLQLRPDLTSGIVKLFGNLGINESSDGYVHLVYAVNIILYSAMFLLPAFLIFKYTKTNTRENDEISFKFILPKNFIFLLPATLGFIAIGGRITEFICFLLKNAGIGIKNTPLVVPDGAFGIILIVIYSAIVPAIVEEILYRKVILTRLLPYGKNFALILSSLLFALMHTDPIQTLYAFIGGYIMGYITIKSGSVIPAMIIHLSNNCLSVIYLLIHKFCNEKSFLYTMLTVDTVLSVIGIVVFAVMLYKKQLTLDEENKVPFSPYKESLRLYLIFYVLYTIYLSFRWIYII